MLDKKVSIIVPTYNTEVYLERCVDSLLAQTHTNIEIILVDDGSTDSSPSICDRYAAQDARVRVVHKPNGGLSSARNAGLDVASGDYIGFVDSDDYVSNEMYALLAQHLDNSGCDIANVMYVRVDEEGKTYPSKVPHDCDCELSSTDFVRELMLHTGDVSVCTKLFRRELFSDVRFVEGKLNEDLLFMLEVFSHVKSVAFVGHVGYYYFVRSGSTSSGYGKAVIDMVGNSLHAKAAVEEHFPTLKKEALRFVLYQHMAYLLLVPREEAHAGNEVYKNALAYIRRNALKSIDNPYLKRKNKLTIILQTVFPRQLAEMNRKKRAR
ncbi:MAG: glycosyltransferase [Clostridia bacterium]|nr:glycosyltransferase [Clostridia bacterium]